MHKRDLTSNSDTTEQRQKPQSCEEIEPVSHNRSSIKEAVFVADGNLIVCFNFLKTFS